jgi:hypothetical protein
MGGTEGIPDYTQMQRHFKEGDAVEGRDNLHVDRKRCSGVLAGHGNQTQVRRIVHQ